MLKTTSGLDNRLDQKGDVRQMFPEEPSVRGVGRRRRRFHTDEKYKYITLRTFYIVYIIQKWRTKSTAGRPTSSHGKKRGPSKHKRNGSGSSG